MTDNIHHCDFLIIGGGIAGLSAAIEASRYGKVILLTKGKKGESATEKAQGGIAAAIDKIRDSTEYHFKDTLEAGAGLCDEKAVKILVTEGVERVKELIEWGAQFDRAETEAGGGFALALEGAHKHRRILHAGDETGAEIEKTLGRKVVRENLAEIWEKTIGIDLILQDGKCLGISALDLKDHSFHTFLAQATILASGGLGQVYLYTTNPLFATGDGVAMAYRAGAEVMDLEFVQFHPTSLMHQEKLKEVIALPQFLISEAVRGEGAELLNSLGQRFVSELAPRDVVARAIFEEIKKTKSDSVYLSLAKLGKERIQNRFPLIYRTCLERGLDITKDKIPVAPAAHYAMGGIKTDVDGKTNLESLYAAGECASLEIHGANRLASNSLLDGLVFGRRAAVAAKSSPLPPSPSLMERGMNSDDSRKKGVRLKSTEILRYKMIIKNAMWNEVGIIRNQEGLSDALRKIDKVCQDLDFQSNSPPEIELQNLSLVAKLICQAALDRTESRGAHYRTDYPQIDDKNWKKHLVYKRNGTGD